MDKTWKPKKMTKKQKEDRLLIFRKMEEVAHLLKEVDDIGKRYDWFDTGQAGVWLDQVNDWLGSMEFNLKVKHVSGMSIDELKKRCEEIDDWTPNAQAWVDKKIMGIKPISHEAEKIERCQIHDGEWSEVTEYVFFAKVKESKVTIPKQLLDTVKLRTDDMAQLEIRVA